jgi:hypothetical protein
MSLNNSSSIVECQSDQCDIITLTTDTSSTITFSSSSTANSPSAVNEFTTERVTRLLKTDSTNYKIVKNTKNNLTSVCWKLFGFPAKKSLTEAEFEPLSGFVTCESCYQTYTFTPNSGTRILNAHICVQKLSSGTRKRSSSASVSGYQMKLGTAMKCYKQVQLPEKEINLVKDLTCKWLCQDMRPFSIVEDVGLRNLLQEFILIGKFIFLISFFLL